MHLRLNLNIINELSTKGPFEVIELSIPKKVSDSGPLPYIRLFFGISAEDLENLTFENDANKPLKCIEFKPKSKFLYREVRQLVQSQYNFCKVIPEFNTDLGSAIDLYCDRVKA